MNIDEAIHKLYNTKLTYKDFSTVKINTCVWDYYYAESELYIIHDRISGSIEFITANSPRKAFFKFMQKREPFYYDKDELTYEEIEKAIKDYYKSNGFTLKEIKEWQNDK